MDENFIPFDLQRMLIGDEPPLFLLEIVARTVFIYLYTLVLIRWVGARSVGQLSMVEFLLVIALGSAVGDAMFYPDVPLVHCLIVITMVVLMDKALSYIVARSPRMEDAIEGKSIELVKDGIIRWRTMRDINLGHDELFEQLRCNGVEQLGRVRAAYFETNGRLSVFEFDRESRRPGLSIVPPWDVGEPETIRAGATEQEGRLACPRCATVIAVAKSERVPACPTCSSESWHAASD